jgi:hypothetical protein
VAFGFANNSPSQPEVMAGRRVEQIVDEDRSRGGRKICFEQRDQRVHCPLMVLEGE